jgi:hypothetical protein
VGAGGLSRLEGLDGAQRGAMVCLLRRLLCSAASAVCASACASSTMSLTKSSGPMTCPSSASSSSKEVGGGVGEGRQRRDDEAPVALYACGASDGGGVAPRLVYLCTACFFVASEQTMHARRSAGVSGTGRWTMSSQPPLPAMRPPPRPP